MFSKDNIIAKEHFADLSFEIKAKSLRDIFYYSALAVKNSALKDYKTTDIEFIDFSFENPEMELNIIEFLSEINYLIFVKKRAFEDILNFEEFQKNGNCVVKFKLKFSIINENEAEFHRELKAISYANAKLEQKNNLYVFSFIIDI